MAQIERREGESDDAFRARQKRAEAREHLAKAGDTVEQFLANPLWRHNNSNPPNLVFNHVLTIFRQDGGFKWAFPGGQKRFSRQVFATPEEALRDLWRELNDLAGVE